MQVYGEHNLPPLKTDFEAYRQGHRVAYDAIEARIGKPTQENMATWQAELQAVEDFLRSVYPCTLDLPVPKSKAAWAKLLDTLCGPVMLGMFEDDLHCVVQQTT